MFADDLKLVKEMVRRYGLELPFVDLGGLAKPTIADYDFTIRTGNQRGRYINLPERPFEDIAPGYLILNPETGHPRIENLPPRYEDHFGTAVCLSVLEHVHNPFEVIGAIHRIIRPGGLVIISTVFSFPYHPSPDDYWRFSPDCLRMLAESAHFGVLEHGWRLQIHGGMGVLDIKTGLPQEIKSVYAVMRR